MNLDALALARVILVILRFTPFRSLSWFDCRNLLNGGFVTWGFKLKPRLHLYSQSKLKARLHPFSQANFGKPGGAFKPGSSLHLHPAE